MIESLGRLFNDQSGLLVAVSPYCEQLYVGNPHAKVVGGCVIVSMPMPICTLGPEI